MDDGEGSIERNPFVRLVSAVGTTTFRLWRGFRNGVSFIGGLTILLAQTLSWLMMSLVRPNVRFRRPAVITQMVRVGVRSLPIIILVQVFIGIILALQMAPTLADYNQTDKVANIIGVAMFRELGPLISAVVLSGFAGASIAAELGSMVEAEEIKALKALGLNPVIFLVMPRVLATIAMLVCLAVISDVVGVLGGLGTSIWVLGIDLQLYLQNTQSAVVVKDFITGLVKAGVFGMLISLIACFLGLRVSGGAEGVGRATTQTVVYSIVALISTDCVFTAVFYVFGV